MRFLCGRSCGCIFLIQRFPTVFYSNFLQRIVGKFLHMKAVDYPVCDHKAPFYRKLHGSCHIQRNFLNPLSRSFRNLPEYCNDVFCYSTYEIIATMAPFLPFASLLVTMVYSSSSERAVSSILKRVLTLFENSIQWSA